MKGKHQSIVLEIKNYLYKYFKLLYLSKFHKSLEHILNPILKLSYILALKAVLHHK